MVRSVIATYSGGVLKPRERLDLEEGAEVMVSISEARLSEDSLAVMRSSAGGWKGLVDAEKLIEDIYESRWLITRSEPKL